MIKEKALNKIYSTVLKIITLPDTCRLDSCCYNMTLNPYKQACVPLCHDCAQCPMTTPDDWSSYVPPTSLYSPAGGTAQSRHGGKILVALEAPGAHTSESSEPLTALCSCRGIVRKMGLAGRITPDQVAKKWDNLKTKYKVRTCSEGSEPPCLLWLAECPEMRKYCKKFWWGNVSLLFVSQKKSI